MKTNLTNWKKNKSEFLAMLDNRWRDDLASVSSSCESGKSPFTDTINENYSKIRDDVLSCMAFVSVKYNKNDGFSRSFKTCKNRFCPICNHFQSIHRAQTFARIFDAYKKSYTFYEAVLTIPNVAYVGQIFSIKEIFANFARRIRKKYPDWGYTANFECTFNSDNRDYHPHLHCTFAFPRDAQISFAYLNRAWSDCYRRYFEIPKNEMIFLQTKFSKLKSDQDWCSLFEYFKYGFKFSKSNELPPDFWQLVQNYSHRHLFIKGGFVQENWDLFASLSVDENILDDSENDLTSSSSPSIMHFTTPLRSDEVICYLDPGIFRLLKTFNDDEFSNFLGDLEIFILKYIDPDYILKDLFLKLQEIYEMGELK